MPNYNGGMYLEQSIQSIIDQTYKNWELIIVDDCSTDHSIDILKEFSFRDKRINVIQSEKRGGGPAIPRNLGLKRCTGQYIAFIDSDDIWHFQKIELQLDYMKEYNKEFCVTNVLPFKVDSINKIYSKKKINKTLITIGYLRHIQLLKKNYIKSCSSVLLEKHTVKNLHFNEDIKYKAVEDWLLWLNIHQYKIDESLWLKEDLVFYRLHKKSISKSKIIMIKNAYFLYSNYAIDNIPLGITKYYYFINYAIRSIYLLLKYQIKAINHKITTYFKD